MSLNSLTGKAAKAAVEIHHLEKPCVVHREQLEHPRSAEPVYCYHLVDGKHGNAPPVLVFLNERGIVMDPIPRPASKVPPPTFLSKPPALGPTISPDTNVLTLNPGDTFDETITVTLPAHTGSGKADVYFLADTTGSMSGILSAVQTGANSVLSSLAGLGIDMMFGVGNYKDFDSATPYAFQHQVSPTSSAAAVTTAVNVWSANGGGDIPEAAFFALDALAVPPGGTIGWRSGSKRIIVWFGDAPSHDPICKAISGLAADVTEASVTAKLVAEAIAVLAISTATPGLDDDPKAGAVGYTGVCGPPGGTAGQGTRIAAATGGAFATGISPATVVNTIINLVKSAVGGINNVSLVPSPTIAPFITSVTPPGGYGPLAGDTAQTLPFDVKFTGLPCKADPQVISGTLDAVADGSVIATKRVQITIPACAFGYSVKFICGIQDECACECSPVRPGRYATEINLHNYSTRDVRLSMRFIPLVLAGAAAGRAPTSSSARAEDTMLLPRQSATLIDCCRITQLLLNGESNALPLTLGFLEITATGDIAVTAVYTTSGRTGNVGLDVRQIAGRHL